MSRTFTIAPTGGWKVGDRAYCVVGSRTTRPNLEVGKVYKVEAVLPVPSHVDDGLILEGVALPPEMRGVWSGRFVRLPARRALSHIDRTTTRVWIDAYKASMGQR